MIIDRSRMGHSIYYRWVIYESRDRWLVGHRWVSHRLHMSQRWVAFGSQDTLQTNLIWVTDYGWVMDKSHGGQTLLHMDLGRITVWVRGGSYMGVRWITNGSHMSHTLVAFRIQHFSSPNLPICDPVTTCHNSDTKSECNFRPIRRK